MVYVRDWFILNAIWILMAAALVLALLVYGRPKLLGQLPRATQGQQPSRLWRLFNGAIAGLEAATIIVIAAASITITLIREGPAALITTENIQEWFMAHGLLILLTAAISYFLYRIIKTAMPGLIESSMSSRGRGRKAREDLAQRVQTLSGALTTLTGITIATIAVFMMLREIGIDITPLLATAGVAGIAIGLGAQSLIKDVLAGLFILMEDQYNKGDVVRVANVSGLVEAVTLKRTVLRDLDGIVHNIPNGEITIASNFTKEFSRLNVDIRVAYGEDMERVIEVINRVGQEMAKDPSWGPKMRSAPQSIGINKFGDFGIEIKVIGDTKPMKQWEVTREFRLRIKKAFDQERIEIPWPHMKVFYGQVASDKLLTCPVCHHVQPPGGRYCMQCGAPLADQIVGQMGAGFE